MSETLATYTPEQEGRDAPEALRPCPFCGDLPALDGAGGLRYPICGTCHATGPIGMNERAAVHLWNNRAVPGLSTTIHWTPCGERLPAYGHTVAVWIQLLGVVTRAYRDPRVGAESVWRVAGTDGPPLDESLVTAWTELPNGALPPPDTAAPSAAQEGSAS